MKIKSWYIVVSLLVMVASFAGSSLWMKAANEEAVQTKTVLFYTVGLDHSKALPGTDSKVALEAAEHFSDGVLGWTLDPSFRQEIPVSFSGQRQEKENLIFELDGNDEEVTEQFKRILQNRLNDFNNATDAGYVFANVNTAYEEISYSTLRSALGVSLFLTFLTVLFLMTFEYVRSNRR